MSTLENLPRGRPARPLPAYIRPVHRLHDRPLVPSMGEHLHEMKHNSFRH